MVVHRYNKDKDKDKGLSLVLWTCRGILKPMPWPYNKPNMALYILAIYLHSMQ